MFEKASLGRMVVRRAIQGGGLDSAPLLLNLPLLAQSGKWEAALEGSVFKSLPGFKCIREHLLLGRQGGTGFFTPEQS